MKIIQEFKDFAVKGNVIDMGVGIIIGAAFGKIVTSFVNDIITPLLGLLTGGVDFSSKSLTLKEATETAEAITLNYGMFITTLLDFVIVAFAIFITIKWINKLKKEFEERENEPEEKDDPINIKLLSEIRDLIKKI